MNVLVVAAHPDDEILGCGGTLAKHIAAGDPVSIVFFTNGVSSRAKEQGATDAFERQKAAEKALRIIGIEHVKFLDLPDNAMDSLPRLTITQALEESTYDMCPDIVYTHHPADLNIDHCLTHEAVMTCFRPQPGEALPDILLFEVSSSTGWASPQMGALFVPRHFVDISDFLEKKLEAVNAYSMEMRTFPHARSPEAVRHLAGYRGSQIGMLAAEAFDVARTYMR